MSKRFPWMCWAPTCPRRGRRSPSTRAPSVGGSARTSARSSATSPSGSTPLGRTARSGRRPLPLCNPASVAQRFTMKNCQVLRRVPPGVDLLQALGRTREATRAGCCTTRGIRTAGAKPQTANDARGNPDGRRAPLGGRRRLTTRSAGWLGNARLSGRWEADCAGPPRDWSSPRPCKSLSPRSA
jgi:hypothetical protein